MKLKIVVNNNYFLLYFYRYKDISINMRAYKYRIYPTKKQIDALNQHFGCVRVVYNWGLETKVKEYQKTGNALSCFDLVSKLTKELKREKEWLKDVNSQSLQNALFNLDNAFTKFFRKTAKFPKFRSKYGKQSFQCPQFVKIDFENNRIKLPKITSIKAVLHRDFIGKIKTVTVSKTPTNKFFVSILIDDGVKLPIPVTPIKSKSIGVDLGIKTFATLSTGKKVENPRYLIKSEKKLQRKQRQFSKKKKNSNNRAKARIDVALVHEKVANQRKDFLHKLSKKLIDKNQAVCLEDLNVSGMQRNHKLAKHISDVGWRTFRTFCEYKAEWYGKTVCIIGRFDPSSKMCDSCGVINKKLKLSMRTWKCTCGVTHDRDVLAARNILNFAFIPQGLRKSTPVKTVLDAGLLASQCCGHRSRKPLSSS